jgi:ribosomal protein S12 methylthiotransferase accessory factor
MEIRIRFPGGKMVAADFGGYTVMTDQPKATGGDATAPAPFDLFLASIGTCAGLFVQSFCRRRGIPTDGLELVELVDWDYNEHRVSGITLDIVLPDGFPDQYREAIAAAANLCTVKKHLQKPPAIEVRTSSRAAV